LFHLESMPGAEAGPEPELDERRKKVDRPGMLSSVLSWVLSIANVEIRELEKGRRGEMEAKDS
jgi:hypothetical protein